MLHVSTRLIVPPLNLKTATPIKNNNNNFNSFKQAQSFAINKSNNNNSGQQNAEMIVQLHELQRKLQQKEDEVKSQEMLMKQQKAFQKRNKTLVARLKAIKKQNNLSGNFNINEGIFL